MCETNKDTKKWYWLQQSVLQLQVNTEKCLMSFVLDTLSKGWKIVLAVPEQYHLTCMSLQHLSESGAVL